MSGKGVTKLLNRPFLAVVSWRTAVLFAVLMVIGFIHGFPFLEGTPLRAKSCRKFFEFSFAFFLLGFLLHPERKRLLSVLKEKVEGWASRPEAIWILSGVYSLLFFWEQVTKHLALEINFLPFLFYDYMLWYFDQGKFCYTGFLHGYYHVNLILLLVVPVWKIFQSPWVLHVANAFVASLAAVPLFYWSRDKLGKPLLALVAAFVYLNFRYLQNLVLMNFAVEVFYPLFIFSAVYFASRRQEFFYYLSVLLGLLVKEDSAIYFGGLGCFWLIFGRGDRGRGFWTLVLSAGYLVFILKVFLPWSGSTILEGDLGNYKGLGSSVGGIAFEMFKRPWLFVQELFVPLEKVRTLFKLTSKLLFLPLISPWFLLVLASVYPVFFRQDTGAGFFVQLSFYYVAAVLPFLFFAFVDGWRRLQNLALLRKKTVLQWGIVLTLILLNGLNLRPEHFTSGDLRTISLAKSLPREAVVVTQGHLLPYLGYRQSNFYIASHYPNNPATREAYAKPDYYLFDFEANPYPRTTEELREMAGSVRKNRRFKVAFEDDRRLLLERKR